MAKKRTGIDGTRVSSAIDALDEIEPGLQHLSGLITVLKILGEADESIEPIAISSLAGCAGETLDRIEQCWRTAIGGLRGR